MSDRYLYDGCPAGSSGYLFDGRRPRQLFDRDQVVVQPRQPVRGAHGNSYKDDGPPVRVACCVEGRAQQAGMFSISGAEDKTPQDQGGLTEVTAIQVIAREWPGDIHSTIWWRGDLYDADGIPVLRDVGSPDSRHFEIRARRTARNVPEPDVPEGDRTWGTSESTTTSAPRSPSGSDPGLPATTPTG